MEIVKKLKERYGKLREEGIFGWRLKAAEEEGR
jgi:hypothetical protein